MSSLTRWSTALLLAGIAGVAGADRSVPVSPGGRDEGATEAHSCPTFVWASDHAERIEIAVWDLSLGSTGDQRLTEDAEPFLRQQLPAGARVWTPGLAECLPVGGRYEWSVRVVDEESWPAPLRFTVPTVATATSSVRDALEAAGSLLRTRHGADTRREVDSTSAGAGRPDLFESLGGGVSDSADSLQALDDDVPQVVAPVVADATAISVDVPATSGLTYGVHGVTDSSERSSAGLIGQSLADTGSTFGVLGRVASAGGIAGVFDTTGGADAIRGFSSDVQVFSVSSEGYVTAVDFAGDGSQLLPPVAGLECQVPCVLGIEIVDESIDRSRLEADSVTSRVIFDGAVDQSAIDTGAVGTSELAAGAVDRDAFALRSIETEDIQANAVQSQHILVNTVQSEDLAANAVTRSKIKGTEIQLYQVHGDCRDAGRATLDSTCISVQGSCPSAQFGNCSGGCAGSQQVCSNTFEGYLLSKEF